MKKFTLLLFILLLNSFATLTADDISTEELISVARDYITEMIDTISNFTEGYNQSENDELKLEQFGKFVDSWRYLIDREKEINRMYPQLSEMSEDNQPTDLINEMGIKQNELRPVMQDIMERSKNDTRFEEIYKRLLTVR